MRAIVLNPISLSIILALLLVYSLLGFELISQQKILKRLEKPLIILLLIVILPVPFIPFTLFHPSRLALSNLSFTGLITTFTIYIVLFFFLKRICFPDFPKGILIVLQNPFLMLLCLMVVGSSLWSQTPILTLRSSLAMVGVATLAAEVAKKYSWQEIEGFWRWTISIVGFVSVPIAVFFPGIRPFGDAWGGFLANSKVLGSLMALNAILWLVNYFNQPKNRHVSTLMIIFSVIILYLSLAKAALVTFFILLYFVLVLRLLQSLRFKQSVIVLIFSTIFSIFLFLAISTAIDLIFQALGKEPTISGRTVFWQQLVETVVNHPLGFGYNGFWQPWRGTENPAAFIGAGSLQLGGYRPPHAHNGFLEVGLQIGLIGLSIFLVSYLVAVIQAVKRTKDCDRSCALFPLILLMYLIMCNLGETEFLGVIGPNHVWFLYALLMLKLNLEQTRTFPKPKQLNKWPQSVLN